MQNFSNPEQTHQHRNQIDAVADLHNAERVAFNAGQGIDANQSEQKPCKHHAEAANGRAAGQRRAQRQAEDSEREVFGRSERHRETREYRSDQSQGADSDCASDKRADCSNRQRRTGTALLGHLVPVDAGHDRGSLARHAQRIEVVEPPYIAP